jgi:hypothetical protein
MHRRASYRLAIEHNLSARRFSSLALLDENMASLGVE